MVFKHANRIPPRPLGNSQKPTAKPHADQKTRTSRRTPRTSRIRHRNQRRRRTVGPKRLGRPIPITTRRQKHHVLSYNPSFPTAKRKTTQKQVKTTKTRPRITPKAGFVTSRPLVS